MRKCSGFDQYKSGGKGSTRQKYLQIWSNETISVDRMGRDEPMIVERPFVTLYGGIQPRLLQEIADGRLAKCHYPASASH
jgi:putative DNA primase/helicase